MKLADFGIAKDINSMGVTASEQGTLIRIWSFPSCTKIGEFRRGVDAATIFSLAFSPNGYLLAATSDKSTLHIFELPNGSNSYPEADPKKHKWGILSKVPLLPRPFSDTYSVATAKFELGDEPLGWGPPTKSVTFNVGIPGVPGGRPTKGLIGWLDDDTILVVGAGRDAKWEKFLTATNEDGSRYLARQGWRNYLD